MPAEVERQVPEAVEQFPIRICECGAIHDRPEVGCPECGSAIARRAGEAILVEDLPALYAEWEKQTKLERREERHKALAQGAQEEADRLYAFFSDDEYPEAQLRFKLGYETRRADRLTEAVTVLLGRAREGFDADAEALEDALDAEAPAEQVSHLHMMSWDAAADLIVDLHSLAVRDGSARRFHALLDAKWTAAEQRGLTSQPTQHQQPDSEEGR